MALTRDFKETIRARARRDRAFRSELLREGTQCLLSGDVETGKAVLRDYINATVGFEALGAATHKSPKSLMRMLGPPGQPAGPQPVRDHRVLAKSGRRAPGGAIGLDSQAPPVSRSLKRCSLPVSVLGSSSRNSMARGYL